MRGQLGKRKWQAGRGGKEQREAGEESKIQVEKGIKKGFEDHLGKRLNRN